MHPKELTIQDQTYSFVKTRVYSPVSIYTNGESFLRIGPVDLISKELASHRSLLAYHFPIASILEEGMHQGEMFYREESLGEEVLGRQFCADTKEHGVISDARFEAFLEVSTKFARAQVASIGKLPLPSMNFIQGVHMDYLFNESIYLSKLAIPAMELVLERLCEFPMVFTQGDFNPHNLFARGVIDFDMNFSAPIGYDLVTAIYHTYAFPKKEVDAEYHRGYTFSPDQQQRYLDVMDDIFLAAGLPKISEHTEDFLIGRLIWWTVRMSEYPKLQRWRYGVLEAALRWYQEKKGFLEVYTK